MRRRKKRVLVFSAILVPAVLSFWILPVCYRGPAEAILEIQGEPTNGGGLTASSASSQRGLRILTTNVAHGRGEAWHQALLNRRKIEKNLDAIAGLLARVEPDVVAVQECDGPSFWSGGSSQAGRLSRNSGLPYFVHGMHVQGFQLSYGTAILSSRPLQDAVSVTFEASPPTFCKGFVVASMDFPGQPGTSIDVVSVHLDFGRSEVRRRQVRDLAEKLSGRPHPRIVMGDFNCDWSDQASPLRELAARSGLDVYEPEDSGMTTFPASSKRIDWVLASPELRFVRYEVLPDLISDHRAVLAEVEFRKQEL
ncbi:MAG: endonuclease/exonuclease/phosphatase family protein [Planctomycetes bacterium]|nr:endonuclease/exonuclease/phosphatase family protein [Planctomycetota bacterium]